MESNLAELPEGWAWTTYEQIGKWSGGGTPSKQIDSYWIGGVIPWISPKDMKSLIIYDSEDRITEDAINSSSAKLIPSDSLLFVVRSGILRRTLPVALTRIDAAVNQDLKALTPSDHIFSDYLLYHALAFNNEIRRSCSKDGTTVESIEFFALKEYPIPLAPIAEQHRIVARIKELFSRLDAGVEALQKSKAQLHRYRQSVLKAAVEGRLTEEWRKSHPDVEPAERLLEGISKFKSVRSEQFIKEYEGELPEGWAWATMEQLTSKVTSGSRGWAQYYSDSGAIFIRAQDIKTDKLLLDQAAFVEIPSNSEGTRTRVQSGDILIVITGANVTKSAIVESDLGEAYVSQHVGLMRPATKDLAPYLYTFIIAPKYGRGVLKKQAYGAGKPGLNLDNIRNLLVRLPPLFEQNAVIDEVGRCMSIAYNVEESVYTHIKLSNRLRQSILNHAFEGRLVPQDPNDEPASVLLERIRAERVNGTLRRGSRIKRNNTHQMRLTQ